MIKYRYINIFKSTDVSSSNTSAYKSELALKEQAVDNHKIAANTQ